MTNQEFMAQERKYQELPNFGICCRELRVLKVASFRACVRSFCSEISTIIDKMKDYNVINGTPYFISKSFVPSLQNYKFKHNFRDTINPMCPTSDGIEDTEHFLLLCPSFDLQRRDLLTGIVELLRPFVEITNLSNDALMQLLLYGDQYLSYDLNRNILELTLRFIHETGRFD